MKKLIASYIVVILLATIVMVWAGPPVPPFSLPSQTGNSGKTLTTNGTVESWGYYGGPLTGAAPVKIYPSTDSTTAVQINKADGTTPVVTVDTTSKNVSLNGLTTLGTSAAGVLGVASGTAPTTSPTDAAQMWVADRQSVAGKAAFHIRDEAGNSGSIAMSRLLTKTVTSTPVTLTTDEVCRYVIWVGTGASAITLPAGGATLNGCRVTFRTIAAVTFTVDPNASEVIDLAGTDLTGGNKIQSPGFSGDQCTLIYDTTASRWRTMDCGSFIDGGS